MFFENSKYYKSFQSYKLVMPFGNYYLMEKFIVGEIHEGMHVDWEKTQKLINEVIEFYGKDAQLAFISNRVNHYSVDPQNWVNLEQNYNFIVASAIVIYNTSTYMNASIEKKFAQKNIKRASNLDEAIEWVLNLREFN